MWFSEEELQIFGELGDTMYDSIAFHKHRAEGETNSTFAYVGQEVRQESFRRCREILWALDVAWTRSPAHQCVVRFLRPFGGPIHLMMRRYRFIEDGLTLGIPETEEVVAETRRHFKLWNRVDATETSIKSSRLLPIMAESERLMFPGFNSMLQSSNDSRCSRCIYRSFYGARELGTFGGVELCDSCREEWQAYVKSFPMRAAEVFPVLQQERTCTDEQM